MRRALVALVCAACSADNGGAGSFDAQIVRDAPAIPDAATAFDGATRADAAIVPDGAPAVDAAGARDAAAAPDAAVPPVTLQRCTGREFPAQTPGEFEHISSGIIALASPEHAAEDVLVTSGASVVAGAKFQYGALFKDLEDEKVRVYLDDCSGWQLVGVHTTDGDGRIAAGFDPLPYGIYEVRYVVEGDATTVGATLWILPPGTHLTVFDIDGTLTTSDFEIVVDFFAELVSGDYVPEAYPFAAAMTRAYRDIDEIGVYITGRPYWLTKVTRSWLRALDFAPGPLFLARTNAEALPTEAGVGTFKRDLLLRLDAAGFRLDTAQGNATTDIFAYLGAGIPASLVWIIGTHAGENGTNAVMGSWAAHTAEVAGWPRVAQPFE